MHFLASLGKKWAEKKLKEKATSKAKDAASGPKSPLKLIGLVVGGFGAFHILLPILFIAVIAAAVFAPLEGVVNFFKSIGDHTANFFEKVGNWFQYGSFEDDETTYYQQIKEEFDDWYEKGIAIDITVIASATNYGRVMNPDADYSCEATVDEDGKVSGCQSEDTDYAAMTREVSELADAMVKKDASGLYVLLTEDEYKAWMLDASGGKSWIERHLENAKMEIPTNPEQKKKLLEESVDQIYQIKDAYAQISELVMNLGGQRGYACPKITLSPGEGMYAYGATLDFEDAVAIWLENEIGSSFPEAAIKAHAIANRTSLQFTAEQNNCVVQNGTGYGQIGIRTNTTSANAGAKKAVQETTGQVMTDKDGNTFWAEVTNFPGTMYYSDEYRGVKCQAKTVGGNYELTMFKGPSKGAEHKVIIPMSEVSGIDPNRDDGQVAHCRGMCQQCIPYQAKKGWTTELILKEYYDYKSMVNLAESGSMGGLLAADASGFRARTNYPDRNNKYFFDQETLSLEKTNRCLVGQCVWYARKRANEILGTAGSNLTFNVHGNASEFFANNKSMGKNSFEYSANINEPRVGAIVVWGGGSVSCGSSACGHVAVIERIENGVISISQMNTDLRNAYCPVAPAYGFGTANLTISELRNYAGLKFIGYIYLLKK